MADGTGGVDGDLKWRTLRAEGARAKGGTVELAVSSDAIVEMPWGRERLLHGPENFTFRGGQTRLPLLFNHQGSDVRGSVSNPRTDGHVLRMTAQFAGTERGREAEQLVNEGHVTGVSVGYRVLASHAAYDADGPFTEVTRWEIGEVSIAPVAADVLAGVGRNMTGQGAGTPGGDGAMSDSELNKARAAGAAEERERVDGLQSLARNYKLESRFPEWVAKGTTVDEAKRQVLDVLAARSEATPRLPLPSSALIDHYGDPVEKRRGQARLTRVLASMVGDRVDAGLERELIAEHQRHNGVAPQRGGEFIPSFMLTPLATRAGVTGTSSLGGAAYFENFIGEIPYLRNASRVIQAGARVLSGLKGKVSFVRQTGDPTASWVPENDGTGITASDVTFDRVTLEQSALMAHVVQTRQLLQLSTPATENIVRNAIVASMGLALDRAALHGSGSGEPTGIQSTSGVNTVSFSGVTTGGAVPTFGKIVDFETEVAKDNALFEPNGSAYITTPALKGVLKQTLKSTTAGSSYIWEPGDMLNGYTAYATNQARGDLTTGTSSACQFVTFGYWPEMLIGEFGDGLEIISDPYTSAEKALVRFISFGMYAVNVAHAPSFCIATDATLT